MKGGCGNSFATNFSAPVVRGRRRGAAHTKTAKIGRSRTTAGRAAATGGSRRPIQQRGMLGLQGTATPSLESQQHHGRGRRPSRALASAASQAGSTEAMGCLPCTLCRTGSIHSPGETVQQVDSSVASFTATPGARDVRPRSLTLQREAACVGCVRPMVSVIECCTGPRAGPGAAE